MNEQRQQLQKHIDSLGQAATDLRSLSTDHTALARIAANKIDYYVELSVIDLCRNNRVGAGQYLDTLYTGVIFLQDVAECCDRNIFRILNVVRNTLRKMLQG